MNIFACSAKKLLTQICTIVYNNPCREIYVLGSSSGLGHRPLTAGTGVRLPYRVPKKLPIRELFSCCVSNVLVVETEFAVIRRIAFLITNTKRYSPVSAASFCVNALFLPYHHVCAHFFEQGKVLLRCSLVILYAEGFGIGGAVFKRGIDAVHHAGINY